MKGIQGLVQAQGQRGEFCPGEVEVKVTWLPEAELILWETRCSGAVYSLLSSAFICNFYNLDFLVQSDEVMLCVKFQVRGYSRVEMNPHWDSCLFFIVPTSPSLLIVCLQLSPDLLFIKPLVLRQYVLQTFYIKLSSFTDFRNCSGIVKKERKWSRSVVSNSLRPHGQ